jgi:hypothetical protein
VASFWLSQNYIIFYNVCRVQGLSCPGFVCLGFVGVSKFWLLYSFVVLEKELCVNPNVISAYGTSKYKKDLSRHKTLQELQSVERMNTR